MGADDAAIGSSERRAGRVLRAGVHGSPAALLSRRVDHPRRVVLRASRVVRRARGAPPADAHAPGGAARGARADRHAVLPGGDPDPPRLSRRTHPRDHPRRRGARAGPASGGPPAVRREPLVLYVGSIFNRRRVPDLIAAFALVRERVPDARLDIIGENRTFPHQDIEALCRASGAGDRIRVRSYVEDAELAEAFRTASVFAFLSEYEGFGLTPLEALARGVPRRPARHARGARGLRTAPRGMSRPATSPATAAALVDLLTSPAARDARPAGSRAGCCPATRGRSGPRDPRRRSNRRAGGRMGDVTIIIVSFNTRAELEACLASLAAAPPSAAHRDHRRRQRVLGRLARRGPEELAGGPPDRVRAQPRLRRREQHRDPGGGVASSCCS